MTQAGPTNPFKTGQALAKKNMATGFVEPAHIDHFQFENQRRTFHSYGTVSFLFINLFYLYFVFF